MPKNKPKLETRVIQLREALMAGMEVADMESVWNRTFQPQAVSTKDGFIVTDKDGRKYEVKICPVAR